MKPKYLLVLAIGLMIGAFAAPHFDEHKDLDSRCERHASWTDNHWWHGHHHAWTCPGGEVVFD